jgi:hypothetical protein
MLEESELVKELHHAQKLGDREREKALLYKLALLKYEEEQYIRARRFLKSIQDKEKNYPLVNYLDALIYLQEGKKAEAKKALDLELRYHPSLEKVRLLRDKLKVELQVPILSLAICALFILFYVLWSVPVTNQSTLLLYSLHETSLVSWSLLLSLFYHLSASHLLLNFFLLLIFGSLLERQIGSFRFLLVFLFGGIVGNLIQSIAVPEAFVLGSSAALFAVLGAHVMRDPLLDISFFGKVKIPLILVFGTFFSLDYLFRIETSSDLLLFANLAHLIGFFVGIMLMGLLYQETIDIFYNWLGISLGFWLVLYSTQVLFTFQSITLIEILFQMIIMSFGAFIIYYSYEKLIRLKAEVSKDGL